MYYNNANNGNNAKHSPLITYQTLGELNMKKLIEARFQLKDAEGNVIMDEEGKPTWRSASAEYDFGDDLDASVELCGAETVHSNYVANATISLQSVIRAKLKAGLTPDQITTVVAGWKPGMVVEKTTIDPETAIKSAFSTWPVEKQREFLAGLGVTI